MDQNIIAYRLVPVYANNNANNIGTACMMECMYTGKTLATRGGGGEVLSPEIVAKLRKRETINPYLETGKQLVEGIKNIDIAEQVGNVSGKVGGLFNKLRDGVAEKIKSR
jgi:hypothetical protein